VEGAGDAVRAMLCGELLRASSKRDGCVRSRRRARTGSEEANGEQGRSTQRRARSWANGFEQKRTHRLFAAWRVLPSARSVTKAGVATFCGWVFRIRRFVFRPFLFFRHESQPAHEPSAAECSCCHRRTAAARKPASCAGLAIACTRCIARCRRWWWCDLRHRGYSRRATATTAQQPAGDPADPNAQ
jgi:hypothetical protein